jgi:tRNA G10  N-methylase Trm11
MIGLLLEGDNIYDPFCGGSVRGIVAGKMGRDYTGIDVRRRTIR